MKNKAMLEFILLIVTMFTLSACGNSEDAASFRKHGMREDWLAAFMMASILLNPQLIIYSAALGMTALVVRIVTCFLCGCFAGLLAIKLESVVAGICTLIFGILAVLVLINKMWL